MAQGNKVALITGAGTGVGRAVSLALIEAGFWVVLTGRRKEPLEETANQAPEGRAVAIAADVGDPNSVKALFAQIKDRFGRLDLPVQQCRNGALPVTDTRGPHFRTSGKAVVDTNLTGAFLCTQEAVRDHERHKAPQGGRIINNGSVSAYAPRPDSAPLTRRRNMRSPD